MASLRFNPNLYPTAGYVYQDADGILHRGESWKHLRMVVTDFRTRNGKPPGDPEREINAYHCAMTPHLCAGHNPVPRPVAGGGSGTAKVANWIGTILVEFRKGTIRFVSRQEAKRRAAICAVCPAQSSLSTVCSSCIASVASARRVILGDAGPVHKSLHPCGILGEDCQLTVHLEQKPTTDSALPAGCWRRVGK